jgi:pyrimidine-nucleoside phosphorylase
LLGNVTDSLDDARSRYDAAISSREALGRFASAVKTQGGDPRVTEDYSILPRARFEDSVVAPREGYISNLDARAMGVASMILGAGRDRSDAPIDPAVGLVFKKKVGDPVRAGERVCVIYSNDRSRVPRATDLIRESIGISADPVAARPLVLEQIFQLESQGAA